MKRFFAFIITVTMLLPMFSYVSAEISGDYEYSIKNGSIMIVRYMGNDESIYVPDTLEGRAVKAISGKAW